MAEQDGRWWASLSKNDCFKQISDRETERKKSYIDIIWVA